MDAGAPTPILPPLPGQDPAAVTASGVPITPVPMATGTNAFTVDDAFLKPPLLPDQNLALDEKVNGWTVDNAGGIYFVSTGFDVDAPGGNDAAVFIEITRLSPALTPMWTTLLRGISQGSNPDLFDYNIVADAMSNAYVAVELGANGALGAAVIQIHPDGTKGWTTALPLNGNPAYQAVLSDVYLAQDGTLWADGGASGILPGQPASAEGGFFLWHLTAAGTHLSTVQSRNVNEGFLLENGPGPSFLHNLTGAVESFDTNLNPQWRADELTPIMGVAADGSAAFTVGVPPGTVGSNLAYVIRVDPATGALVSERRISVPTATLSDGETWTGSFRYLQWFIAGANAWYLAGPYGNDYAKGANPMPSTVSFAVLKFDPVGSQLWFRQFSDSFRAVEQGTKVMAVTGYTTSLSNPTFFTFDATDGSLP